MPLTNKLLFLLSTLNSINSGKGNDINQCGIAPPSCPLTKYRSFDGSCNNLNNPKWGTPGTEYDRLLPANYRDGISGMPVATSGKPLPNARNISALCFPDKTVEHPKYTLDVMQYGQFVSHDMSLITLGGTQCCTSNFQFVRGVRRLKKCAPIKISNRDPDYSQINAKCMELSRTITNHDSRCSLAKRAAEQLTAVNIYLDLSTIYGNSEGESRTLRTFRNGSLLVEIRDGHQWLPHSLDKSSGCPFSIAPKEICYRSGDPRTNQHLHLTLIHIMFVREHNRLALKLAKLNPHWDDEKIFQESRKINIAQYQHITYHELLPVYMGWNNLIENKIIYNTTGHVNDYTSTIKPAIFNEHSQGAYRGFHSLITGDLKMVGENRDIQSVVPLNLWFDRPSLLEDGDTFDALARGLHTQKILDTDLNHHTDITKFLFKSLQRKFGLDLKSLDIQRSRDHGIASYNDMRKFCGMKKATAFKDFSDVMDASKIQKLQAIYEDPNDVDLLIGGQCETILPDALTGPTFLCILNKQFLRSRVSDRFWYENGNDVGFTLKQLRELRKSSISKLFCDNGNNIKTMQPKGFHKISEENKLVPCDTLPFLDLTAWKEREI